MSPALRKHSIVGMRRRGVLIQRLKRIKLTKNVFCNNNLYRNTVEALLPDTLASGQLIVNKKTHIRSKSINEAKCYKNAYSKINLAKCYLTILKQVSFAFHNFFNDIVYPWSLFRISLQTSPYHILDHAVCHHCDLLIAPFRIWQFPDAHLTEKNSKTVDIDLIIT